MHIGINMSITQRRRGNAGTVRRAAKLTTTGKLVGDVVELCNNHGGQKLGKATIMMWVKANLVPDPMPGTHSNIWGIIKSTSLYAPSRYVQGYTGVDGLPLQRQRFQYDVGGGTIDDASQTPNGHGYMPNSMLVDATWKHVCLVKTGDPDVNTYAAYTDGVIDVHGNGSGTPAEMDQMWLGFDGNTDGDVSNYSYACVRVWRDLALTQAQVQAEKASYTPVLNTKYYDNGGVGLFRNWKLDGIADLTDSVDGAVLTATGTTATDNVGPTL